MWSEKQIATWHETRKALEWMKQFSFPKVIALIKKYDAMADWPEKILDIYKGETL